MVSTPYFLAHWSRKLACLDEHLPHQLKVDRVWIAVSNAAFADGGGRKCIAVRVEHLLVQDIEGDVVLLACERYFHRACAAIARHAIDHALLESSQVLPAQAAELL